MKNKNGFTLAEILIVIALIGVIMLLVVPNITKTLNEGKKKAFATQVQKVLTIAEDTYAEELAEGTVSLSGYGQIYCSNDIRSQVPVNCYPLNTSGEKLQYIVAVDQHGTSMLGVANKDFCYSYIAQGYYDKITTNINQNIIMIGGSLTCSSRGCQCVGGTIEGEPLPIDNGYVYWGKTASNQIQTGYATTVSVQAIANASPGGVVTDYSELEENRVFVRSTVVDSSITKHEACLRNEDNDKVMCLGNDYYVDGDSSATETKLVQDITSKLSVSGVSCSTVNAESQHGGAVHNVTCSFTMGYLNYQCTVNEEMSECGYNASCNNYSYAFTESDYAGYESKSSQC